MCLDIMEDTLNKLKKADFNQEILFDKFGLLLDIVICMENNFYAASLLFRPDFRWEIIEIKINNAESYVKKENNRVVIRRY